MSIKRFATHLWFNNQAEEAAKLYTTLFPNSHIDNITKAPVDMPGDIKAGSPFVVNLTIMGQKYIFLNGGPMYKLGPQVSLYVSVDGQEALDKYWNALVADGGKPLRCGWVTDRFGLSWQIIPSRFEELVGDSDKAKVGRVTQAMLKMQKLDICGL